ncbi:MAG: GH25 family lysozyme, partial [Firmicutes bacterium]|nr:GH25 family lysozyme [Bacillota bacterium]
EEYDDEYEDDGEEYDGEYEDDDEEYDGEYEDDDEEYDGEYEDDDEEYDDEYEDDDEEYDDEYEDDDEEYDDEYEDDEEYEDDDDIEDGYEEPEGVFGRIAYKITHMSAVDYVVTFTGAAVLILAVVTGSLYFNAKSDQKQVEAFAEIGIGMEEITMIGQSGLVAVSDAQASKLMAAELEQEEELKEDAKGEIEVLMNLSSVQKDLKIKFTNKKTGKLIANVGFVVEIEKPSGGTYTKEDDDKDGIIYQTDMTPGKYRVKITSPASDQEYSISSEAIAITVRDKIEYKKIDVSDEVKTEAQVNVAVEDTKVNETVVESTNTDTVEWVESTKTLIEGTEQNEDSYEKVDNSQIADPGKAACLFGGIPWILASELTSPAEPSTVPTEVPTASPAEIGEPSPTTEPETSATPTVAPAETATPEVTATPTIIPTVTPTVTPEPSPSVIPTVSPTVTPTASPTATPTASPTMTPTATPTATPNQARDDTTTTLKTTDGEALYVKDDAGNFREAKYADYYTNSEFYRKVTKTTGEYRYTGWQTIDGVTYFFDKDGNKVTGEQVIQGAKYSFNSDGSLNNSSGHLGIDVSKWNGNIDWNAVKNSGVSYVIIRCGYRGSTTGALIEDPKFRSNIQGASKAGLKVGVYFFTQAVNEVEAVEEASMVLGLIRGYNISYPVFLDVEPSNGRGDAIDSGTRTAVCRAFCQTIQNSGYKAGIYANKTWLNEKMDAPGLSNFKIWLAQYAAAPTYTRTKYDMWQYSSKGSVAGISGTVDMNISYMGY